MNKTQNRYAVFAREYLKDLNATRAAIAAGYSKKSAGQQASELLKNPKVKSLIEKANEKRIGNLDVTAERVLQELAKLAYSNMEDYTKRDGGKLELDFSRLNRDQMAAIQEITEDTTGGSGDGERKLVVRTKFKLADKGANLERLGRHLKLFTDRVEHSGTVGLADLIANRRKIISAGDDRKS